jgi:hypothetical protein
MEMKAVREQFRTVTTILEGPLAGRVSKGPPSSLESASSFKEWREAKAGSRGPQGKWPRVSVTLQSRLTTEWEDMPTKPTLEDPAMPRMHTCLYDIPPGHYEVLSAPDEHGLMLHAQDCPEVTT